MLKKLLLIYQTILLLLIVTFLIFLLVFYYFIVKKITYVNISLFFAKSQNIIHKMDNALCEAISNFLWFLAGNDNKRYEKYEKSAVFVFNVVFIVALIFMFYSFYKYYLSIIPKIQKIVNVHKVDIENAKLLLEMKKKAQYKALKVAEYADHFKRFSIEQKRHSVNSRIFRCERILMMEKRAKAAIKNNK